jgi:hypothetical protein
MEGEKIIFEKLTPVVESPNESSPPVVASPALQQTSIVELPAMQQLPCVQLKRSHLLSKNSKISIYLHPLVMTIMRRTLTRKLTYLYLPMT